MSALRFPIVLVATALVACGARSALPYGFTSMSGARDAGIDATADAGPRDGATDASLSDGARADGAVDAGRGCGAGCTIGATMCVGGALTTCVDDGRGCAQWDNGASCSGGTTCTDGVNGAACEQIDVQPPRPIGPLSTSRVTSQRPTFHWVLAGHDDGAKVEICHDRGCSMPVQSFDATGTKGAPPKALAAGTYFWRLRGREGGIEDKTATSAVWQVNVPARSAPTDTSWGSTLDLDGDGYADLAVGAHEVGFQGAIYVYMGGPNGIADKPIELTNPSGWYGTQVTSAGDLDGDGFPELIGGGYQGGNGLFLYRGGPGWSTASPIIIKGNSGETIGAYIANAGDINGDGYGDLLISSYDAATEKLSEYVYFGSAGGITTTTTRQLVASGGWNAVSADVNGDGLTDVVVAIGTASQQTSTIRSGSVRVYLGTKGGLSSSPSVIPIVGNLASTNFTMLLTNAGDVNGDGYADIALASPEITPPQLALYLGGPSGLSSTPIVIYGPPSRDAYAFAYAIANVGDLDHDGFDELAAGAPGGPAPHHVYVYKGAASGPSQTPWFTLDAPTTPFGNFGDPIAAVGDVNRDGFADFAVSAMPGDTVYVYLGSASGVGATPFRAVGPSASSFGESLALRVARRSQRRGG